MSARFLCPVCWSEARPTIRANIASHFDSIRRDVCPGGGEPFRIALLKRPEYEAVAS